MAKERSNKNYTSEGKLYKSSLRLLWPVAIVGYVTSVLLILEGQKGLKIYPAVGEDPFRYIAGHLPILIAVLIAAGVTFLLIRYSSRRIGISPNFFLYRQGQGKINRLPWDRISILAPYASNPGIFSVARVTDGKTTINIEKFFYPEFTQICEELKDARKAYLNRAQET